MIVWYILIIVSLLLNIYCIINIFMGASAAQTQLNLCKLRGEEIKELQKEIYLLKTTTKSSNADSNIENK